MSGEVQTECQGEFLHGEDGQELEQGSGGDHIPKGHGTWQVSLRLVVVSLKVFSNKYDAMKFIQQPPWYPFPSSFTPSHPPSKVHSQLTRVILSTDPLQDAWQPAGPRHTLPLATSQLSEPRFRQLRPCCSPTMALPGVAAQLAGSDPCYSGLFITSAMNNLLQPSHGSLYTTDQRCRISLQGSIRDLLQTSRSEK